MADVRVDDEDHAGVDWRLVAEFGAERAMPSQDVHKRQRVEEAAARRVLDVRRRMGAERKGVTHTVVVAAERKGCEWPASAVGE